MTAAPPLGMCGACREADCECCDLLVWGGPCDCGCVAAEPTPVLIFVPYVPARPRRKERTHCLRGHELTRGNVYRDSDGRRRCWKCRRASWRRYQYRKGVA